MCCILSFGIFLPQYLWVWLRENSAGLSRSGEDGAIMREKQKRKRLSKRREEQKTIFYILLLLINILLLLPIKLATTKVTTFFKIKIYEEWPILLVGD